jgi:ABC-type branched-subunit amino acid transport system ATPase component
VQQMGIGQHKLIDLARAAIGQPPVVLLDEPAVGLTGDELEHLKELLLQLKARGCAVVIVEHNIGFVSGVAERGIVLDHGVVIAYGSVRQIFADPDVQKAYFGVLT